MSLSLPEVKSFFRRPLRLRYHLITVFLVTMTPLFLFAVYMIYRSVEEERATFRRGAIERTRAIMTAVDSELKSSITTLEALATSRELDGDDLRLFYDEAMRVFKSQRDWTTINVADASGQQLMNLLRPFGSELPLVAEPDKVGIASKTQRTVIGNLVLGTTTKQLDFAIRTPVVRNGQTKYVISGVVKPTVIGELLAKQQLPRDWVLAVMDANHRIVTRTLDPERTVGEIAAQGLRAALPESAEGWGRGRSKEEKDVYRAYTRSPFSGWSVSMNISAQVVDAPLHGPLLSVALLGLGLLSLGIALALLLSSRTAASIESLSSSVVDLGLGKAAANHVPSRIAEVEHLRDAFLTARRLIQERSDERDQFEREVWRQASLLELTHDAVFVREFPHGPIIYWNRGAEALYGYPRAGAMGHSPHTLLKTFHPRGMDFVESELAEKGEWSGELIHTTRDGRKICSDSRHVLAVQADGKRIVLETNRDISVRKREEKTRQVQSAVNGILAESPALIEATPKLLRVLCELGEWDVAGMWEMDRTANELACVEVWHPASVPVPDFEADTRPRRFAPGTSLVGRVLESREPEWIADVTRDRNFLRAASARNDGIHAGFCFPIKLGEEVLGAIECFSREIRPPDVAFVQTLTAIGGQLGQFIQRKRAEEALELLNRILSKDAEPVA